MTFQGLYYAYQEHGFDGMEEARERLRDAAELSPVSISLHIARVQNVLLLVAPLGLKARNA